MARQISSASLAKLAQTHGAEPVIIIDVEWSVSGGGVVRYATKDIVAPSGGSTVSVPGKIIEFGTVDSVVAVSANETSEEFDLILDDTDGTIKSLINVNDIMLRNVTVYQWFEGLNFEDRFIIFEGKINSPISWSETDRTVKFNVVSQLEDKDVGFSPEEGTFPDLPDDMVGKLWPECFGTSVHEKAIQVDFKHAGSLGEPVGLRDFTLGNRINALNTIRIFLNSLGVLYAIAAGFAGFMGQDSAQAQLTNKANGFFAQANQKQQEASDLNQILSDQAATERSSFRVIGGEHFPRGLLKLNISDAIFTGSFSGTQGAAGADIFTVNCADHPEAKNFYGPTTPCGNPGCAIGNCKTFPFAEGITVTQAGGSSVFLPSGNIPGDQAGAFFAQGGAAVSIFSSEPLRYFVSITPGTVLKVAAFSTFDGGERVLVDVPTSLYNVYTQSYGSVQVTVVEVTDALSKQEIPWEDTIYVTYQSSVGPNTIDILSYLIDKYSDVPRDAASFDACRTALINYPMHFCLTRKKNIVTVIKELAFMARLAISIKSGKFFCRYLPEEPTSVFTFSESNVLTQSVELEFTGTEDLVTKYVANWRQHGAQDEDNRVIMRYNVKKYGTHEQTVDFYAYNYISAIVKSLTFWINRKGHTWKKLRFSAALDALNVETFDGVTLNFNGDYASTGSVLGEIEEGSYNADTNQLDFVAWTGVRSGEMTQYTLAYPKDVSTTLKFPDPTAEAAGFSGGDGPGNTSGGSINRVGQKQGVNVGFTLADPYGDGDRQKQDRGSFKPSDVGDQDPGTPTTNPTGSAAVGVGPPPTPDIVNTPINDTGEVFWIDIRSTEISDSQRPGQTTTLDTFFYEITDGRLKGSTASSWTDGADDAVFDFKYDTEGAKWGAGTAFLKED
jgi:hypothetical protein